MSGLLDSLLYRRAATSDEVRTQLAHQNRENVQSVRTDVSGSEVRRYLASRRKRPPRYKPARKPPRTPHNKRG